MRSGSLNFRGKNGDLAANMWANPGEIPGNFIDDDANGYVDDVHGIDSFNNNGDPFDDQVMAHMFQEQLAHRETITMVW